MKRKHGHSHSVVKKPRTISASRFYQAAKSGVQIGKQLYKGYRAGKRLYNTTRKVIDRYRKSRASRTNTKLSTTVLQGISQHNDWAKRPHAVVYVGRKDKPTMKTVGSFKLHHTLQGVKVTTQGVQALVVTSETLNRNNLSGTTSNTLASSNLKWDTDPFQLNPYSTAPNNAIYTNVPAAVVADDKLFLKSYDHKLSVLSMCTVAQKIRVMYFLVKKNTSTDLLTMWADCYAEAGYLQAANATGAVNLAGANFTSGIMSSSYVGEVPTKFATFRKYFKLVHSDQFMLQPGDQMTKTVHFVYNKMVTKQMITEIQANDRYVPGWTICPLIIAEPGIIGVSSALGTDATEVAPGIARIGYMQTDKFKFAALPANRFNIVRGEPAYIRGDVTVGEVFKIINDVDTAVAETFA